MNVADLRPASIGQLLDRAVTLGVKFFVPLALIYAAYDVLDSAIFVYSKAFPFSLFQFICGSIGFPLMWAAFIETIATICRDGRAPSFAEAYYAGTRRWLHQVGLTSLWFGAIVCVAVFGLLVDVFLLPFVPASFLRANHGFASDVAIVILLGIPLAALVMGIASGLALAISYSYCAIVLEDVGPVKALSSAVFRTVLPSMRGRLWNGLIACGALAVLIAIHAGLYFFLLHALRAGFPLLSYSRPRFYATFLGLLLPVDVIFFVFISTFLELAYFDMRVRTEGLDLESRARVLDSAAPIGANPA